MEKICVTIEPAIVRTGSGRLQVRLAPPGRMTRQAWDLLLDELAGSNNLRHSAAAGVAHSSVIAKARGDRTRPAGSRAPEPGPWSGSSVGFAPAGTRMSSTGLPASPWPRRCARCSAFADPLQSPFGEPAGPAPRRPASGGATCVYRRPSSALRCASSALRNIGRRWSSGRGPRRGSGPFRGTLRAR